MENLIITTEAQYYKALQTMNSIAEDDNSENSASLEDEFDELASAISLFKSTHLISDPLDDELDLEDLYEDYVFS